MQQEVLTGIPYNWKIAEEDKKSGDLITHWVYRNGAHSTTRRRLEVQIGPIDGGYRVEARVEVERVFPSWKFDVNHKEDADWDFYQYDGQTAGSLVDFIALEFIE